METKLALYFLDYESQKIYNYFSLGEKGPLKEINKSIIIIDVPIPKIIYDEHFIIDFKLYKNNKEANSVAKSFNLDIYINRLNQYYCFINCINNYSFDIIIFRNDYENLPKAINIKGNKNYSLDKCNMFGLKRCKKFGVINCDKSYISEYDFHFPAHCVQGSYYLNVFYPSSKKNPKFSLQKIRPKKQKNIDFNSIPVEKKNFLLQMKGNFINLYNQFDKSDKNEEKTKFNFMSQLNKKFPKENISFYEFADLRYLLARNANLHLSNEEFDICLGYVIYSLAKKIVLQINAIIFAGLIIDLLNELQSNLGEHNLNILKILLWFYKNYICEMDFINSFKYNEDSKVINSSLDFKLCFPKKCAENTPYHNAYIFMNNFIDKLSEDSFLLEILYLIDSEASSNRIYKSCRLFKFSLLSLEQIKSHLKKLIPEVIIRYKKPIRSDSNGSYIINYGLIRIFENEIIKSEIDFDKYLINEKDIDCKYSIPIIMVLIRDCFCHGKIRLSGEGNESPNYFYNPHNDYELSYHTGEGESGRLFEFYISKNKDVIRFLKYSLQPLSELLEADLWVGKNLDKLNQIVIKKMENFDMEKIENQKIAFFPTGEKEENLIYAENQFDYDSEEFADLYEDDKKITKRKKKRKDEIFC